MSEAPTPHSPPHGDAEQRADDEEDGGIGGEARAEAEQRETEDAGHQRRAAAVAVGQAPEEVGAERAHGERQGDGVGDGGDADAEFFRHILEDEHHDEEVERVERPAQVAGGDDVALVLRCWHGVSPGWG